MSRTALLLGASGVIGGHVLQTLLNDPTYAHVTVLVRRAPANIHPKLKAVTVDFEQLDSHAAEFGVDDVFCCLGSTIRKAGSRAAFERVDHHYIVESARLAKQAGVRQFLLISAVGASAKASAFYSRVKGHTEDDVTALAFPTLHILRPSLLLGERAEHRAGEEWAKRLAPAFAAICVGPLAKYRPVEAGDVAARMVALAKQSANTAIGTQFHYFE